MGFSYFQSTCHSPLPSTSHVSLPLHHFLSLFLPPTPPPPINSRSSSSSSKKKKRRRKKTISGNRKLEVMPPRRFAFGRTEDAMHPDTIRAAISEFFATALFVFAAEGSVLALGKIYQEFTSTGGLISVAVASGLALATAVAVSYNISGGHVNPAVTFGVLLGSRISLVRAIFFWVAQLLGAIVAALLLRLTTGGMRPAGFAVASGVGVGNALLLEIVLTFGLMYAIYATAVDPKRGHLGTIAPLIIGFILAANIIAGGPFDGASMNPARTFGPSLVGWRWKNHWIYWVGPFIGAGLAGLIYEYLLIPAEGGPTQAHQPLAPEDY